MKSIATKMTVGFLFAAASGAAGSIVLAAPPAAPATAPAATAPAITRTEILNTPLEGLKGLDGIMYVTDVPPGLAAPRHSHPGYEFNYVLKGSVVIQLDGGEPFTLKAGQSTYNVRNHVHKVRNASMTEPAQILAVLIHDMGKPLAVPAP
ncbi:MAG TPA: cupin domain-containing protein [Rhizomicrobium sp.]|nr:cupin domain-containing protein [Rhizomicrobium sp.]